MFLGIRDLPPKHENTKKRFNRKDRKERKGKIRYRNITTKTPKHQRKDLREKGKSGIEELPLKHKNTKRAEQENGKVFLKEEN